jgi:hypothetical protein
LHVLKLLKNVQSEPKLNSSLKFKNFVVAYEVSQQAACYKATYFEQQLFYFFFNKITKILYCICFFCNFYISSFIFVISFVFDLAAA